MIDRRAFLRGIASAATVSIVGGSIAGCSNRPVGEERDPKTVTLWGIWASDAEYEMKVVEKFSEQNPDITVNVSQAPNNGLGDNSPVITAVRGRTAPDIWFMDRFNGAQFASIGLLEPINDLIEEYEGVDPEEFMSGWIKFATDELSYMGQWYGLPMDTDTRALYYNKKLTKEAGVDPKWLDPANGPMTLDQMWEISDSFDKQNKRGTYERLTWIPWDDQASLFMWTYDYNVSLFDNDSCNVTLDSPDMLKLATAYSDWVKRLDYPRVDAFKATYQPPNAPPTQTSFFSDRQMFQITGPWGVGSQRDYRPKMEYGVTHLPIVDSSADPVTWAGGFALTMPKGSSKSKAAWDLMKFYAGYEGQKTLLKDISRIPTNIKAAQDPNAWDPDIAFFVDQMAVAKSRLPLPVGSKVWDSMFTMQGSLNQSSKTPQQAVDIAQNYVNPTMQQFCPMTLPKGFGEPDPTFTK